MSSTENPTTKNDKKGGRPFSGIWDDITRGESKGNGHYSGKCKYCSTQWSRAKPNSLKSHLIQCNSAPSEVRNFGDKIFMEMMKIVVLMMNVMLILQVPKERKTLKKKQIIKNLISMIHAKVIFIITFQTHKMNWKLG